MNMSDTIDSHARGRRRAYRASILTCDDDGRSSYVEDGLLVVGPDGRIEHAGPPGALAGALVVQDLGASLIVPGFVDTHLHFPQTRVVGSATGPLLDWLGATVFPEEAKFADDNYAAEVAGEFLRRCASVGTTTISAYSSSHPRATEVLFDRLEAFGLREDRKSTRLNSSH